jgi:hypothetical protein
VTGHAVDGVSFCIARGEVARLPLIAGDGVSCEYVEELTYLMRLEGDGYSSVEVIRNLVNMLEVQDIRVEEEAIEDIVKRVYLSGEVA